LLAAREKALQVVAKLRASRLTKAAELVETGVAETLAYYELPEAHWRRIRTNNPLKLILCEMRRRSRIVGAFPDGQSALNLASARLRYIAGSEWSTKRLPEHGAAEGEAHEPHHCLSPVRPPLSPN
jgi:transposase-like protein